jgi:hypothetical protein
MARPKRKPPASPSAKYLRSAIGTLLWRPYNDVGKLWPAHTRHFLTAHGFFRKSERHTRLRADLLSAINQQNAEWCDAFASRR